MPSILFRQRAWFSEDGRAGEHRLPHLRAHPQFHEHQEFGVSILAKNRLLARKTATAE